MRLLPIKIRPECDSYHCCYYIELSDTAHYAWRIHVDHIFSNGAIESPENNHDYDYWIKYL